MRQLNYRELVERLPINKHTLDDELEHQAAIQHMISEKLSKAREHKDLLESELDAMESRLYVSFASGAVNSGKKPSIDYIKNQVKVDGDRKQKFVEFNEARAEHERWEGLYYAWRARNDALQALSKLAVANYFAVETTYDRERKVIERSRQERPARRRVQNG
jgi:hypothetical protein